jgi:putative glutamine amidotransferase
MDREDPEMAGLAGGGRPLIGVTGPDKGGFPAWLFTWWAVRRAGGKVRRITPSRPFPGEELDGLIVGGGADVDPGLYEEERQEIIRELKHKGTSLKRYLIKLLFFPLLYLMRRLFGTKTLVGLDRERDDLEQGLLRAALERGIPILGICRGMQLLNVILGGTLHQDLTGFYSESPQVRSVLPKKEVLLEEGSLLSRILNGSRSRVNALHWQGVDRLGEGVRIAAKEPNGVVQGIEHTSKPFVLGVQWHPEFLPQHTGQRRIFESLVREAGEREKRKGE